MTDRNADVTQARSHAWTKRVSNSDIECLVDCMLRHPSIQFSEELAYAKQMAATTRMLTTSARIPRGSPKTIVDATFHGGAESVVKIYGWSGMGPGL